MSNSLRESTEVQLSIRCGRAHTHTHTQRIEREGEMIKVPCGRVIFLLFFFQDTA